MFQTQILQSFALPHVAHKSFCYPEGNFEGNQLLDGSISLSPLYSCQTNDLHVSIASDFHQDFSWLHPAQAQFTIFRVPTYMLKRGISPKGSFTADEELVKVIIQSISLCLKVYHSKTRTYVRLLGPCFKTGRMTKSKQRQDEQWTQHEALKEYSHILRTIN